MRQEMPLTKIKVGLFDIWENELMGLFPPLNENFYILRLLDYLFKWVKVVATPMNDAWVVRKFVHKDIYIWHSKILFER